MCKCCDSMIPKNSSTCLVFRPNGRRFINGLSDSYDIIYYDELQPYMSEAEFKHYIEKLIDDWNTLWPCNFCFYCSYVCSFFTLGLSFCIPNLCISDALESLLNDIENLNQNKLLQKNLKLSLQRRCCTSWLQIELLDKIKEEENNCQNEENYENKGTEDKNRLLPINV